MIGIFGGTFDPVHNGHLRAALEVHEELGLRSIRFIPCRQPPHRSAPAAAAEHRLAMLRLAVQGTPGFAIDERELARSGPSYTVDTLDALHSDLPRETLALVLGADAFAQLHTWHEWKRLFELAHIIVVTRPGEVAAWAAELERELEGRRADTPQQLQDRRAGRVWFQAVTPLAVSASRVRALVAAGRSARYLVPEPVWDYIREHQLYRTSVPAGVTG